MPHREFTPVVGGLPAAPRKRWPGLSPWDARPPSQAIAIDYRIAGWYPKSGRWAVFFSAEDAAKAGAVAMEQGHEGSRALSFLQLSSRGGFGYGCDATPSRFSRQFSCAYPWHGSTTPIPGLSMSVKSTKGTPCPRHGEHVRLDTGRRASDTARRRGRPVVRENPVPHCNILYEFPYGRGALPHRVALSRRLLSQDRFHKGDDALGANAWPTFRRMPEIWAGVFTPSIPTFRTMFSSRERPFPYLPFSRSCCFSENFTTSMVSLLRLLMQASSFSAKLSFINSRYSIQRPRSSSSLTSRSIACFPRATENTARAPAGLAAAAAMSTKLTGILVAWTGLCACCGGRLGARRTWGEGSVRVFRRRVGGRGGAQRALRVGIFLHKRHPCQRLSL